MTDAIAVIAPQSTGKVNTVEQGSGNTGKDGSQFSDVLSSTIKEDRQDQAKDAKQNECQSTEQNDDKQAHSQVVELRDGKEAEASSAQIVAQLMAVVNAQVPHAVLQTDVSAAGMAITEFAADAKGTGKTIQLQTDAVIQEPAAWQGLSEAMQATVDNTNTVSGKEAEEQPVIDQNSGDVAVQSKLVEGTMKNTQTVQVGSYVKTTETNATPEPANTNQSAKTVDTSTKVPNANQPASDNKAASVDASSQTRIEVTASAEPSREFTIKPQVMSPVSGQAESTNTLISDAVSQVASTEKSGVNADTSGSQNNQAGLYAGQTTVKQTTQAQPMQATTNTDQPLHTRIIDQIVHDIKLIKLPQQSDLVVKITPPELGTLRVQITQAEQGLTTQIQTSGEQVKGLLQAHLPALNQAFSDAGLKMDSVSVTSGTSFGSLMQDSPNGGAQQQSGQRHHYAGLQDANGNQTVANMPTAVTGGETTAYSWLA